VHECEAEGCGDSIGKEGSKIHPVHPRRDFTASPGLMEICKPFADVNCCMFGELLLCSVNMLRVLPVD
jgi:hypothetical protein